MTGKAFQLHNVPRSDLQKTLATLPHLLDEHVGLIHSLNFPANRRDDPRFVHAHAYVADISRIKGRLCNQGAGGTALHRDAAIVKAIGEAVERYSIDMFEPDVQRLSYKEAGARAIDPRRFILFHPNQYQAPNFPFTPFREDRAIGWMEAYSLTRGETVLVPASMAHLSYTPRSRAETFELAPLSGYACGNTIEEAILRGIYEVVERDAFMIFWYNWLPVPAIDLSHATSPELKQTIDRYHCAPVSIHCSNITTETGIPAVLAVMVSQQPGWPAAVVATAADLDPEQAITRALLELSANHLLVRSIWESGLQPIPRTPFEVRQQEDHGLFYVSPERLPYLNPVLRPASFMRPRDFVARAATDVKQNIETCIGQLAKMGMEVIVLELTSPDVRELGFRVVKVLIPGMQPIDFGVQLPHLGGQRVYQAPLLMGHQRVAGQPWELNLFPHPFP
jgi:ribosomal protein S12 methylthiotransferase accessory factor